MSTFSSVVNKSGKKFAPKATARRNVTRRPSSITPSSSEVSPATFPLVHLIEDAVNSSDLSLVQSSAEQDVTSSALPSSISPSAAISTPVNVLSAETDSVIYTSETAENPVLAGEAGEDALREGWAVHQEQACTDQVAKKQSKALPATIKSDQVAHQASPLPPASRQHDTSSQEEPPPVLEPSSHVTRTRNVSSKRKLEAGAGGDPDMAPRWTVAADALPKDVSTVDSVPRKRQKVAAIGARPRSASNIRQNVTSMAGAGRNESLVAPPTPAPDDEDTPTQPLRVKRKSRVRKTMQQVAAEVVGEATGDTSEANEESVEVAKTQRRKRRGKIPLGAEDYEIAPSEVKMADLVKDRGLGKGSTLEARLQAVDWDEVKKKRKEAAAEAEKQRELEREEKRTGRSSRQNDVPAAPTVPKLTIKDNQIVMEEDSRMVDRHAELDHGGDDIVKVQDINDVTRRVNQSTIGRQSGVKQKGHWNDEMTDLFYKGLRMFGTDFMMISKMFPGMSRRHIKLKYTREERTNLARVNKNLITKEDVDMEEYSQMSNQVYEDPEIVKGNIRAEEQRLRDEDVARRARETEADPDEIGAEDGNVLQSREQGTAEPGDDDGRETTAPEAESSAKENRFASVARSIVQRATAPKKTKKQNPLARKRERKQKTGLEGTEEVVGSIEDIQRE